jgi:hypothetical protein
VHANAREGRVEVQRQLLVELIDGLIGRFGRRLPPDGSFPVHRFRLVVHVNGERDKIGVLVDDLLHLP